MLKISKLNQIILYGLIINIFLSIVKFLAGYYGNSKALTADSIHSLSDSITDIIIIIGALFWTKPPDEKHQYGHARIETITTMILGIILCFAAIGMGYSGIKGFSEKKYIIPEPITIYVAFVSIFIKESLYRVTLRYGKTIKSPALIANAWHHRLDALSSIPAFIAVGGAILFPTFYFLDSLGAIIVSIFILHAAIKIIWPGIEEILESGASPEICSSIKNIADNYPGVVSSHKLRTRYQGTKIMADIHILVDGKISVKDGHDIAEDVKKNILKKHGNISDVVIHIEPDEKKLSNEE